MAANTERTKEHWYTPSELLEMYPKIASLYTPQRLGYLAMAGGVNYRKRGRTCLISEEHFIEFLKWRYGLTPV